MTATGSVEAAVDPLDAEIKALDAEVPALLDAAEADDPDDVFVLLGLLQRAEGELGKVRAAVEAKAARLMTKRTQRWPDGMLAEREARWRESWDHRGAALAAVDPLLRGADGEHDPRLVAIVDALLRAMRPSWRTTVLDERVVEDFRTRERTGYGVKVTLPTIGGAS
jgi:hypothetical protein